MNDKQPIEQTSPNSESTDMNEPLDSTDHVEAKGTEGGSDSEKEAGDRSFSKA